MLSAFTAGLLLITISELGDKTFFITAVLAMRYPRRPVLLGSIAALGAMTILSVILGQAVSVFPKVYIHYATVLLFLGFGVKLLYDAGREWLAQSRNKAIGEPEAPCQDLSDQACPAEAQEAIAIVNQAEKDLKRPTQWGVFLKAFTLTFLAEWGDRTQFATIALATAYNPFGVTVGAIVGHSICAAIAVICGRLVAGRISEQMMTALGGALFIIFGMVAWFEGV